MDEHIGMCEMWEHYNSASNLLDLKRKKVLLFSPGSQASVTGKGVGKKNRESPFIVFFFDSYTALVCVS